MPGYVQNRKNNGNPLMSEREWICKNCLKTKNEVVQLKLFHMNFTEAIYMCVQKGCVFPFNENHPIQDYIVENKLVISESDLIDSDDEGIDMNSEHISTSEFKDISPMDIDKILTSDTFGVIQNGENNYHPVENHTVEAFDATPMPCDIVGAQVQHTDSSQKNLDCTSFILNSECVLENFGIPMGEDKNIEFSNFYEETVFTDLISELAAYAENPCELEPKANANQVSDTHKAESEINKDGDESDASQLNITHESERVIAEEKNENGASQFNIIRESERVIAEEKNENDASQISDTHKSESEINKDGDKYDACQLNITHESEKVIAEEKNENGASQVSDTHKSESEINKDDGEYDTSQLNITQESEKVIAEEKNENGASQVSDTHKSESEINKDGGEYDATQNYSDLHKFEKGELTKEKNTNYFSQVSDFHKSENEITKEKCTNDASQVSDTHKPEGKIANAMNINDAIQVPNTHKSGIEITEIKNHSVISTSCIIDDDDSSDCQGTKSPLSIGTSVISKPVPEPTSQEAGSPNCHFKGQECIKDLTVSLEILSPSSLKRNCDNRLCRSDLHSSGGTTSQEVDPPNCDFEEQECIKDLRVSLEILSPSILKRYSDNRFCSGNLHSSGGAKKPEILYLGAGVPGSARKRKIQSESDAAQLIDEQLRSRSVRAKKKTLGDFLYY